MAESWAASALSWWEEAGVDTIVGEAPRDWLNPAKAAPAPAAIAAPVPAALPETLEAFQAWLAATPDLPFATASAPRAAPVGDPASGLMVMVDMASSSGGLIDGEAGLLFDRMLGAIQRSRETIYLAALSPIRPPAGRVNEAALARLAEIARRHIALARPKAVLLLGDTCGKALLGASVAAARGKWQEIATDAGPIKALVTIKPENLQSQPALKKLAWADLQLLMEAFA